MPNVPGQNQHVIRPGLFDFVRMIDGNMSSGQEAPLLVGASIDGIVDEIGPDAAVIEERVSFCCCSHTNDGSASIFQAILFLSPKILLAKNAEAQLY